MFYSDFDEELECYGVFHTEKEGCFGTFSSEEQADEYIAGM